MREMTFEEAQELYGETVQRVAKAAMLHARAKGLMYRHNRLMAESQRLLAETREILRKADALKL